MAKKAVIRKVSVKKQPRKTRSEVYLVNFKYLGDEPDPAKFKTVSDTIRAYTWYNSMCEEADARQYLKDYFTDLVKQVDLISKEWIPWTQAWQCRIATRLNKKLEDEKSVREAIMVVVARSRPVEEKPKADKPDIQARMRERASDIIGDIEAMLDTGEAFSLYDWLKKNEIPAMYAAKIADFYKPLFQEYYDALSGDKDVLEGYRNVSKAYLKARATQVATIIEDANKYGSNTKKLRVPRKKKPMSVEKKLKYFRYQKEDKEMKLASVAPESVVGAQELWTYNTKYKTLTIFRAIDRGGLDVKRSNIVNYDEKATSTRRTGRQAEKLVKQVLDGGKVTLRKLMDELKEATLQDRINENTILLRIVK